VADNSLALRLLDWEPQIMFEEGLNRTMDWYFATKSVDNVRAAFDQMLSGRGIVEDDLALVAN
jgi:dTDP-D-glucose 4,6-dehydratase